MTRIPTLEEIMTSSPYELVDTPFANDKIEAWKAQSIATGASGALAAFHRLYQMVRNDTADAAARADEAKARETLVAHLCDQVSEMQERINRLADALELRHRQDAEAARHQRRLDEEPITLPPDISAKQTLAPPKAIGDETHHPEGGLHSVDPKDKPEVEDAEGDLPPEIAPPPEEPVPEPKGSVFPQPIGLFGN
jgi:hypothetical protein